MSNQLTHPLVLWFCLTGKSLLEFTLLVAQIYAIDDKEAAEDGKKRNALIENQIASDERSDRLEVEIIGCNHDA